MTIKDSLFKHTFVCLYSTINKKHHILLVFLLLFTSLQPFTGYAQIADPISEQNSLELKENSPELEENSLEFEQQALARHVQSLNELTERRRTNRLFHNEQTPLHGQRIHYTNVGKGNTSFVMRDMVLINRLPIVFARVYDSSSGSGEFGKGFRLNYSEHIKVKTNGNLVYFDESGSKHVLTKQADNSYAPKYHFAQIESVEQTTNSQITLRFDNRVVKIFKLIGGSYKLKSIDNGYGSSTEVKYRDGKIQQISNKYGQFIAVNYNNQGFIDHITDHHNRRINYTYKDGLLKTSQDLAGNLWQYRYKNQLLHKITDPEQNQVAKFNYYQSGEHKNKTRKTTIGKQTYTFAYDGNITSVSNQLLPLSKFEQNAKGVTTVIVNHQGLLTRIALNDKLQVVKLFENDLTIAEIIYNNQNQPIAIVSEGQSYPLSYSANEEHYQINGIGSVSASINANGKPLSFSANGMTRHYSYNSLGEVVEQREQSHQANTTDENPTNKTTEILSTYRYNPRGLLASLTVAGKQASFEYNQFGQLAQINFPDSAYHRYQYNDLGLRSKTTRSDGSTIDYVYDKTGNLLTLNHNNAKGDSLLKEMRLDDNNLTTEYIVDGQMMLDITYDDSDNPIQIAYNGQLVEYKYDAYNRLTTVIDGEHILNYNYQNGESDIRIQQDERSFISRLAKGKSSHNSLDINHIYTRTIGTPHRFIYFDPYQDRFNIPSFEQIIATDINHDSSQRRRLYNAVDTNKNKQRDFDKPSNSAFMPGIYAAINCEAFFCWELIEVFLSGPSTATVGQNVTFTVDHLMGNLFDENGQCDVRNRLSIDGNIIGYSSGNVFNYTFGSAGTKQVEVRSNCQNCATWNFQYHSIFTDVLSNKCNVDFELNGTSNYQITSGPAMPTITANVTHLHPPEANIEWSAQIKHSRVGSCAGKTQFDSPVFTGYGASFTPNWQGQLFGGDVIIKATCTANGYDPYTKTNANRKVLGIEPSNVTKGAYIGLAAIPFEVADLRKIACLESSFKQFSQSTGLPTYGPGGDAGLGQICFRQTSQHQWDWHANLDYAEEILTGDSLRGAKRYLDSLVDNGAAPYSDDMLRLEAIHRYNAGCCSGAGNAYWGWETDGWKVIDTGGVGGYVTHVTSKGDLCTY